ncbi:hypothetical protein P7C70_g4139, partial [Phenoliferia sp. Uapishka_3]
MSTTLISISNASAYHLVGTNTLPLTPEPVTLTLLRLSPATPSALTIQLGALAFALSPTTKVGTQAGNPRGFFLKPDLPDPKDGDGVTGWVKIELSQESVDTGLSARFEEFLVEGGWLLGGKVEAGADEVGAGIRESGIQTALTTSAATDAYVERTPSPIAPTEFSSFTHKVASSTSAATGALENAGHYAAVKILSVAGIVGEYVGSKLGAVAPPAEGSEAASAEAGEKGAVRKSVEGALQSTVNSVGSVASGVSDATSTVYDESTSSMHTRIDATYGSEAAELSGEAGKTAENVGGIGKDVLLATSVLVHGGLAADGVRRGASSEEKR